MALLQDEMRGELSGPAISDERKAIARETPSDTVRAVVEHQFTLMEQAHDRIRAEELAARLIERPES